MNFAVFSIISILFSLVVLSTADIVWPKYSQQCRDDAGTPFGDDEEIYGPDGFYHDKTAAFPVLVDGKCAKPLEQACKDRPTYKAAYLEGPIDCGDNGWYCRIMPDENWPPINLIGDLNFGHCNTTDGFEDAGYDRDGHCHGSSVDNTYYWWIRDHFFRQYNGRLRCCCGWYDGSEEPLYGRRIANRCDYRRLVTETENLNNCRDANEGHGLGFDDIGCDPVYESSQLGKPIPENDDMCWEIQRFGYTEEEYSIPTANPASPTAAPVASSSSPTKSPTASVISSSPSNAPAPTPTAPTPTAPTPTAPTPTAPTPSAPTPTAPTPTAPTPSAPTPTPPSSCEDSSVFRFKLNKDGLNIFRDCEWAARRSSNYRCNLDEAVSLTCPDTCGTCDECFDSPARLRFRYKDRMMTRNCEWVGNKDVVNRCQIEGIAEACRETCEVCD